MSVRIMSRVWEKSKQGGSQLLLLLAVARGLHKSIWISLSDYCKGRCLFVWVGGKYEQTVNSK